LGIEVSIFNTSIIIFLQDFSFGSSFFIYKLGIVQCHTIHKLGVNLVEKLQVVLGRKVELIKHSFGADLSSEIIFLIFS